MGDIDESWFEDGFRITNEGEKQGKHFSKKLRGPFNVTDVYVGSDGTTIEETLLGDGVRVTQADGSSEVFHKRAFGEGYVGSNGTKIESVPDSIIFGEGGVRVTDSNHGSQVYRGHYESSDTIHGESPAMFASAAHSTASRNQQSFGSDLDAYVREADSMIADLYSQSYPMPTAAQLNRSREEHEEQKRKEALARPCLVKGIIALIVSVFLIPVFKGTAGTMMAIGVGWTIFYYFYNLGHVDEVKKFNSAILGCSLPYFLVSYILGIMNDSVASTKSVMILIQYLIYIPILMFLVGPVVGGFITKTTRHDS